MSTEHDVKVVQLGKIGKHPNADTLSITDVEGRPVILRTGEFNPGDLAVYLPVDTMVPLDDPRFTFLKDRNFTADNYSRIKAVRLRGIFSMGLLVKPNPDANWIPGQRVETELRTRVWEPAADLTTSGDNETDPGYMPVYTDIESLRKWRHVFSPDEEVILTEKVHGCLRFSTRITMADGSKKSIANVQVGDHVLGVNEHGKVTDSTVTQTFKNGLTDNWLKITGKRTRAGRGNHFFAIKCTPEHKFWDPISSSFKEASQLKVGDKVSLVRTDIALTPIQEQVLLGKLLGDASLSDCEKNSANVVFGHSMKDYEYAKLTKQALGDLDSGNEYFNTSGFGSPMVSYRTVNSVWIKNKFSSFYEKSTVEGKKRVKVVPEWVADELTPISLAFWYMDDGSLGRDDIQEARAGFATCAFTEKDCRILMKGLKKLGINSVYKNWDYSRIILNADDAERLFLLIAPYIPPSMQRKLPPRYRGCPGWIPATTETVYKSLLVEQEITSITPLKEVHVKYDIETETHNYFAADVLVHNSNARYLVRDDRLWCGSRTGIKKQSDKSIWWSAAKHADLENKLKTIPNIAVYGEVYGQVQDLKYGVQSGVRFVAFDAMDTLSKRYLDTDQFLELMRQVDLPTVPILYRGPYSGLQDSLSNGKSVLANGVCIREGFVIKPVVERYDIKLGRVVAKLVGEDYLLRKEK